MADYTENADNLKRYKLPEEFRSLSHSILNCANRGEPKSDFLCEVAQLILRFSGCDTVRIISLEGKAYFCCSASKKDKSLKFEISVYPFDVNIKQDGAESNFDPALPFFTSSGSFWTGNADQPLVFGQITQDYSHFHGLIIGGDYKSIVIIPIMVAGEVIGALKLLSRQREHLGKFDIGLYETVAQTLGVALVNQRAQAALRERVKELTCLYGIATLAEKPDTPPAKILQGIVDLLPLAWQYPEITCAKIVFNGGVYLSAGFKEGVDRQKEEIIVDGKSRGYVEVIYTESKPTIDEGPFLKEERNLIDAVATQINLIIEQKQAEEERQRLQEQLRHADRLATIGQLSAGVAHELNEPLGNILGFAQLAKKEAGLSGQVSGDLERIINASLHAREVVKKLMLFARQTPPRRNLVDLNKIINEGLYFLESRCSKAGVELVRCLDPELPLIMADQSQLNQVLVNLVVNAIQAMPDGGTLTIRTTAANGNIILSVEDSGIGMSKEIMEKLFIPFFTTKDVNEGTGLGLSVVHGIVTLHGGTINVRSAVGQGSVFEIQLPLRGGEEVGNND
jgi:two-component system NtrC family sensor kinase